MAFGTKRGGCLWHHESSRAPLVSVSSPRCVSECDLPETGSFRCDCNMPDQMQNTKKTKKGNSRKLRRCKLLGRCQASLLYLEGEGRSREEATAAAAAPDWRQTQNVGSLLLWRQQVYVHGSSVTTTVSPDRNAAIIQ